MSYRELRDFTESMKALGYPRLLPLHSFRNANFELTADLLYFLLHRYDPTADVSDDISSETKRVEFIQSASHAIHQRSGIRLNQVSLYRADGFAVKELLKLSSVLYDAIQKGEDVNSGNSTSQQPNSPNTMQLSAHELQQQLDAIKRNAQLAQQTTELGSKLYHALSSEQEEKSVRDASLAFIEQLNVTSSSGGGGSQLLERVIAAQINSLQEQKSALTTQASEFEQERATLQSKVERKSVEVERAEKRLQSLAKVRPAFMDEYALLEQELAQVYTTYVDRHRALHYCESVLAQHHAQEMAQKRDSDLALRRMQKRLRDEELKILRGDNGAIDSDAEMEDAQVFEDTSEEEESSDPEAESGDGSGEDQSGSSEQSDDADGQEEDEAGSEQDSNDGDEEQKRPIARPKGAQAQRRGGQHSGTGSGGAQRTPIDEEDEEEASEEDDDEDAAPRAGASVRSARRPDNNAVRSREDQGAKASKDQDESETSASDPQKGDQEEEDDNMF